MRSSAATDYDTYREIMSELMSPISGEGLDPDTLKRLYESKLVYLDNLRTKCFRECNGNSSTPFTWDDYAVILTSIDETKRHLRELIIIAVADCLTRRAVGDAVG